MIAWARQALDALERRPRVGLVTVLAAEGSAPRDAGTRMVVTEDALIGTIGGGNLEHQITRQARALLERSSGEWRVQDYPLGPFLGQCCGGRVRVMLETVDRANCAWLAELAARQGPVEVATRFEAGRLVRLLDTRGPTPLARGPAPAPGDILGERMEADLTPVLLFGAGHVGRATATALAPLPFAVKIIDQRPELAVGAVIEPMEAMEARLAGASAAAMVLIMTHDHALDYRLTRMGLNSRAKFIGLIGSETKRARFLTRLRKEGISEEAIFRLHCPIGLPGLKGKEPAVIAASVAAHLLLCRN